jgi:hypothetical protein
MENYKRREFIRMSLLTFAGISLGINSISAKALRANAFNGYLGTNPKLNWDAFLTQISSKAKVQNTHLWKEVEYLEAVKKLLLQCNFPEFENVKLSIDNYKNNRPDLFEHTLLHTEIDFQVSLFQFEKGEYISHHDHPKMCGVINVISGEMDISNYSFDKNEGEKVAYNNGDQSYCMQPCILKKEKNELLKAGDVSILTSTDSNIHEVMPNSFAQLIDIFTPAYNAENDNATKWFNLKEKNYLGENDKVLMEYFVC